MIGLLLASVLAWADDLPLRVIDEALVTGGLAVPSDVQDAIEATFRTAVRETWPEAAAAGDARQGGPVSAKADPVVHVGIRLTRFEEDRFAVGDAKTVEVLRATVAPFAVDLGSGELIASTPYSFVVTGERVGTDTASDATALRETLVGQGVPRAVERFAAGFAPDRLVATVVDRNRERSVIARGRRSGSFVGERWRTGSGEILEVVEVGDDASFVVSPTGGPLPPAGSTLQRPGLARPLGEAPRVLVAPPLAMPEAGPDGESVTMWVEEALARAGWVVVPRGTELFGAQLEAAARLDIAEESLLNAQTPPERVAVPRLWRLSVDTASEETGTARLAVAAGLQVDVFDLATGLLVQSLGAADARRQDTRIEVVDPFTAALRVSLVKDTASVLATEPSSRPEPALPRATVEKTSGDGVSWTAAAAPLPAGVIGEVQRAEAFADPTTGAALAGPADAIGVARVLGLAEDQLRASWIAAGNARRGDRFVAVGGRAGGPPVRIETPTVEAEVPGLAEAARAGLHRGEGINVAATDEVAAALDEVTVRIGRSGFAGEVERRPVEARHALATAFTVKVDEVTKGKTTTLTIRVDAVAEVTRDGTVVPLKPPSATEAAPTYAMWTEQTLELPKAKKKQRALNVPDVAGAIRETVHRTATTLSTRVAVMLGS